MNCFLEHVRFDINMPSSVLERATTLSTTERGNIADAIRQAAFDQ
jgi:hypothetical protein